jgi:hypothetical protein
VWEASIGSLLKAYHVMPLIALFTSVFPFISRTFGNYKELGSLGLFLQSLRFEYKV